MVATCTSSSSLAYGGGGHFGGYGGGYGGREGGFYGGEFNRGREDYSPRFELPFDRPDYEGAGNFGGSYCERPDRAYDGDPDAYGDSEGRFQRCP